MTLTPKEPHPCDNEPPLTVWLPQPWGDRTGSGSAGGAVVECLEQGGDHLVQVTDDRVVRAGHHRGGRVGVDRDDVLRARTAGEVLDLDGPIGGYNFQAAWSTGWLAGTKAAED